MMTSEKFWELAICVNREILDTSKNNALAEKTYEPPNRPVEFSVVGIKREFKRDTLRDSEMPPKKQEAIFGCDGN